MKTTLEEPTIVAPDPVIDADAPPKGDLATMDLSGNEFETKLKAAEEAAAFKKEKAKAEPDKKETKKDEPPKKEEPAKDGKKTPLDVAPSEKKDDPPAVEEELETLIASEPPPNASASSKANHAAMRKGLERANTTISELRTKLEESSSKVVPVPAELEERLKTAEKLAQDREVELERVAFKESPRYKKLESESEAEITAAKGYLEGVKTGDDVAIDPNVIDLAARAQGSKRSAILIQSGMDASTIGLVASHLARADAINRESAAAQENWKETNAQWTAERTKAAEAKTAQIRETENKVFAEVGKKVAEELAPFQHVEGNDEWNAGKDERLKLAQEYFDGKKPLAETSRLIYDGIACPVYKQAFEDLRTKYNDLVQDNERTKAARPGAAGTSQDNGTVVDPKANPMELAGSAFEANQARHGG